MADSDSDSELSDNEVSQDILDRLNDYGKLWQWHVCQVPDNQLDNDIGNNCRPADSRPGALMAAYDGQPPSI